MHDQSAILVICGTRPEAIKCAPVIEALRRQKLPVALVDTGQHPDLMPMVLREAGLRPDHELHVARTEQQSPQALLAALMAALGPLLQRLRPPLVLVQGDTVSAFAGALAAAYAAVPVAHIEAGLRTGDMAEPFPEEMHRRLISGLATLHFAPTRRAAAALLREGVSADAIRITGNSGVDAFHRVLAHANSNPALDAQMSARLPLVLRCGPPLLVATMHRRENLGDRLANIAAGLARLAREGQARIIVPLHPNPQVQAVLRRHLDALPMVQLTPALDHQSMAWLMQQADLLLTDSGGLQEEAPSLGLRTLVLRHLTERQEAIEAGMSELVELTPEAIHAAVLRALALPRPAPFNPFGDGHAADRIAAAIRNWLPQQVPAGVCAAARTAATV